ncbi:MAG TPA: DUF721 domain-containing protein [Thiolapillus brandeum]|uniref:DUF721 domain-containing protein n=1 Tax=Thiolapillus brandeum TaxID=1076588 RepID=A0A831NSA2_9GAMM|nr:DUF721 domain-containing protein [Thiolapillus brandeum]
MTKKPRTLSNVVNNSEQLGHLAHMLQQQQALLEQIRQLLPTPLRQHCLHARISGVRLILHADSPVWGTRLRFHAPQIIQAIIQQAPRLKKLDIRILLPEANRPGRKPLGSLPETTALLVNQLADSIDDQEIRAALKRLSGTSES